MKYDDLEKTQDLFDIKEGIPKPIENIEMEGASKNDLTADLDLKEESKEEPVKEEPTSKKTKNKNKKSLKTKWQELPKKKKIILIIILCLILILLISLIIVLTSKKKKDDDKEKEPVVIVEKENYIYEDGLLKFLNADEEEIGTYECENKDENKCYIVNYSNEDNFDGPKQVYEDEKPIERRSSIYLNNFVFIHDDSKDDSIILYNIKEQKVENNYSLVKGFSDTEYVILKDQDGKYGLIEFIDDSYTENLEFKYDYIGIMNKDSNIIVKEKNKYYVYSKDGKALSKGIDYEIKSYNNNYIAAYNGGYYVYDYEAKLITEDKSEYIYLLEDYFVSINDKSLFIKDYSNKYNEEGIKLSNEYYNPLNVYDKNKTLIETKEAFSLNLENNTIDVAYTSKNTKKNKIINTYEGKLSSTLNNLNYFDGTLYFYKECFKYLYYCY